MQRNAEQTALRRENSRSDRGLPRETTHWRSAAPGPALLNDQGIGGGKEHDIGGHRESGGDGAHSQIRMQHGRRGRLRMGHTIVRRNGEANECRKQDGANTATLLE